MRTESIAARELIRLAHRMILTETMDCRRARRDFERLAEEELILAEALSENGLRTRTLTLTKSEADLMCGG